MSSPSTQPDLPQLLLGEQADAASRQLGEELFEASLCSGTDPRRLAAQQAATRAGPAVSQAFDALCREHDVIRQQAQAVSLPLGLESRLTNLLSDLPPASSPTVNGHPQTPHTNGHFSLPTHAPATRGLDVAHRFVPSPRRLVAALFVVASLALLAYQVRDSGLLPKRRLEIPPAAVELAESVRFLSLDVAQTRTTVESKQQAIEFLQRSADADTRSIPFTPPDPIGAYTLSETGITKIAGAKAIFYVYRGPKDSYVIYDMKSKSVGLPEEYQPAVLTMEGRYLSAVPSDIPGITRLQNLPLELSPLDNCH